MGIICKEYLRLLNNKMRGEGRNVLLTIDNFSGHELGVSLGWGIGSSLERTNGMASSKYCLLLAIYGSKNYRQF